MLKSDTILELSEEKPEIISMASQDSVLVEYEDESLNYTFKDGSKLVVNSERAESSTKVVEFE